MFERYTEKARRVIFFARYEASQGGSPEIDPAHVLLGITREDPPLLAKFAPDGRGSIEKMRSRIQRHVPEHERIATSVELPLAPESKRVLHYAHEESDRLRDRHVGTEHLLLGLMREERSIAADTLSEFGLHLDAVREALARDRQGRSASAYGSNDERGRRRIRLGVENLLQSEIA